MTKSKTFDKRSAPRRGTLAAAIAALNAGFTPIPLKPGSKQPAVRWDPWRASLSEEKLKRHFEQHPDHELAILTDPDLFVLDADTPEAVEALRGLEDELDMRPKVIVRTRRGEHHYFRLEEGVVAHPDAHGTPEHPERIDIKAGRSVVAIPPSTDKRYEKLEARHRDELTVLTQEQVDAFYTHNGRPAPSSKHSPQDTPVGEDPEEIDGEKAEAFGVHRAYITELLDYINPDCGYQDWFHVAAALHHESGGSEEGFEVFDKWSSGGESKYEGSAATRKQWRSLERPRTGPRITLGTIVNMAKLGGANVSKLYDKHSHDSVFQAIGITEVVATTHQRAAANDELEEAETKPADEDDAEAVSDDEHPLRCYSLRGQSEELRRQMAEAVPLPGGLGLVGQWTTWYASPNTGKTLLALYTFIEAIKAGIVVPDRLYYANADDSSAGIAKKVEIAEAYGFHMISPGHNDFELEDMKRLLRDLARGGHAPGTVLVLDTLKKFTSLMRKDEATAFGRAARQFISQGGTLLALAHTNKHLNLEKKPIPAGTTDVTEDSDCAFTIRSIGEGQHRRIIEFECIKQRGPVERSATFSYSIEEGILYDDLLASVTPASMEEYQRLETGSSKYDDGTAEIMEKIRACIQRGVTGKTQIIDEVAGSIQFGKKRVREVLDTYQGDHPDLHCWRATKGPRGLLTYELLKEESANDDAYDPREDNEDVY